MDLEDKQYNGFRGYLGVFGVVAVAFCLGGWAVRKTGATAEGGGKSHPPAARRLVETRRKAWYLAFSLIFIIVLHGSGVIQLAWIVGINFLLARGCARPGRAGTNAVLCTWVFGCSVVLLCEYTYGARLQTDGFSPLVSLWFAPLLRLKHWHARESSMCATNALHSSRWCLLVYRLTL
jgi:hypothetical protein